MTTTLLKDFQRSAVQKMTGYINEPVNDLVILLDCPTAGGKTLMIISTVDETSRAGTDFAWYWFAPFKGLIEQTQKVISKETSLHVRDIRLERRASTVKTGDVFVMTWATVARADPEGTMVRSDLNESMPSIDRMIQALRDRGFKIGCVVDEEHLHLKGDNEALAFCADVLKPDVMLLATATPKLNELTPICHRLGLSNFRHVAVSREDVVTARLNKRGIRSLVFQAQRNDDNALIDAHAKAIQLGTQRHHEIKRKLVAAGIPVTPLLLVQVGNQRRKKGEEEALRPTDAAKKLLLANRFTEQQIAIHTSDEPDADLMRLAENDAIEVIIFKTAIATGFDVPRAWTLVALRKIVDENFGLQIVGRTMRVHPLLQKRELPDDSVLEYAHVVLATPSHQKGLGGALVHISPENLQEMVTAELQQLTDNPVVEMPPVGPNGDPPIGDAGSPVEPRIGSGPSVIGGKPLGPPSPEPPPIPPTFRYALRQGMPTMLLTDYVKIQDDSETITHLIIQEVADKLSDGDIADALIRKKVAGHVIQRQFIVGDDGEQISKVKDNASLDRSRHMMRAMNAFKINIEPALPMAMILGGLCEIVRERAKTTIESDLTETDLLNAVYLLLSSKSSLIRDAYNAIVAKSIASRDASPLPSSLEQEQKATSAKKNIYGIFPPELNKWERQLAESLDDDPRVVWWHRNKPAKDYSVSILRASGNAFYPDFVVKVHGRKKGGGIVLLDPHERTDDDAKSKVRSEHTAYGKPYMLRLVRGGTFHILGYNEANDTIVPGDQFDLDRVME